MTAVADAILSSAIWLATLILAVAFLLTAWRVIRGPTLPDRVVALDMLVGIVIGFIALTALRTGFALYVDIALALGLVGFLATIAFARFILPSRTTGEIGDPEGGLAVTRLPVVAPPVGEALPDGKPQAIEPKTTKSKTIKPKAAKSKSAGGGVVEPKPAQPKVTAKKKTSVNTPTRRKTQ